MEPTEAESKDAESNDAESIEARSPESIDAIEFDFFNLRFTRFLDERVDSPDLTDEPDPLRCGLSLFKCSSKLGPSNDLDLWGGVIVSILSTNESDLLSDSCIRRRFMCFFSSAANFIDLVDALFEELDPRCESQTLVFLPARGLEKGTRVSLRLTSSSMAVAALDLTEYRSE